MAEGTEPVTKKQKSRRSKVWAFFTDNLEDEVAGCNLCGKCFSQKEDKNGTKSWHKFHEVSFREGIYQ